MLWAILLNGGVLVAAFRLSDRRTGQGHLAAACDAGLIYFVAQYVAVAAPALLGLLSFLSISVTAVALIALIALLTPADAARPAATLAPSPNLPLLAAGLFVGGFLAAHVYVQRFSPPLATDALVYHLPTAVQWMQTGRLGIFPTWYWNPAASYSPASGSTFMAWWMILAGNELFVRFVQIPALLLIFCLIARFCLEMKMPAALAGLIAVAATLSRPLFSEAIIPKDDLYVTAFVLAALRCLCQPHLPLAAPRLGLAMGMTLASKYTVLLAAPLFLFALDGLWRRPGAFRWPRGLIALLPTAVLALPWYARNLALFGNPLYPVDIHLGPLHLPGLFAAERDQQLRTVGGVWKMLAQTYHSLPLPLLWVLAAGWLAAVFFSRRRIRREPLVRVCVVGSVATLGLFLLTSPHHEVRYVFPQIALLFAAAAAPFAGSDPQSGHRMDPQRRHTRLAGIVGGAILAALSIATCLDASLSAWIVVFAGIGLLVAGAGVAATIGQRQLRLSRQQRRLIAAGAASIVLIGIYVYWSAYVSQCRQLRMTVWSRTAYPRLGALWSEVDKEIPADATIAYANTYLVYPLYDFDYHRRVVYAPVRRGLHDFRQLPPLGGKVPGDLIVRRMTQTMDADPDASTWRDNLRAAGAEYLLIAKGDPQTPDMSGHPPELDFALADPEHFRLLHEDEGGVIFKIAFK